MKDDIEKVDEKLKILEESVNKINDSALRIDDNLKVKRNEIQKLDTINKDLQRVILKFYFSRSHESFVYFVSYPRSQSTIYWSIRSK
jgi:hypothetical protein